MTKHNDSVTPDANGTPNNGGTSRKLIEKSLLEIKRLRKRVAELERSTAGDIAIVGMACRFPGGVNNLDDLWQALDDGRDCIAYEGNPHWPWETLYDANPEAPGKLYTKASGLVDDPLGFDADFFGISPREANEIDPQQRMLMEVSHQAMENGGYALSSLKGSNTGVFMGVSSQDYSQLGSRFGEPEDITPWQGTGVSPSAAAGRLSYLYDFTGPSMAVDTACSSSLVALHYACQSLRQGECDHALVGGVNMILNPATSILFAKANMLSVDGRCKTFDKEANGYVRSEGCSVVMIKMLDAAVADGDHIHGVIRGSAVNQDGRSQGLTAPNELSQQRVIRSALAQASCDPADVSYVEAHGTGTPLGDPIEVNALHAVYGASKGDQQPLLVGSAKSNFGHSEAASGMCGLLKVVLSLQNGVIPKSLHFTTPNPFVDWPNMNVRVSGEKRAWPDTPKVAGLSGFGFTGTNVHVIVGAYEEEQSPSEAWYPDIILHSAKNAAALAQQQTDMAQRVVQQSAQSDMAASDLCYTLAVGRDHYHYRSAQHRHGGVQYGAQKNKAAIDSTFHFSGQEIDSATVNILATALPGFPQAIQDIAQGFGAVQAEGSDHMALLHRAQHALEYQYGLAKTWIRWGVTPKALVSVTEGNTRDAVVDVVSVLASELAAAMVGGLISIPQGVEFLVQCIATQRGSSASLTPLSCRRPRVQFYSQFVVNGQTLVAFSSDKSATERWARGLVVFATNGELPHHDISMQAISDKTDVMLRLDESVSTIISPAIAMAETDTSIGYARPVQGSTPSSSTPAILFAIENALLKTYVAGIDIIWAAVFSGARCYRQQLPGYAFQRKTYWNPAIPMTLTEPALSPEPTLPQWSYGYDLEPVELVSSDMALPQYWLVMADTKQTAQSLYAQLVARGHECVVLVVDGDQDSIALSYLKERRVPDVIGGMEDLKGVLLDIAKGKPLNVVLSLCATSFTEDAPALQHQYEVATTLTLWLGQSVVQLPNMALWTVTANGIQQEHNLPSSQGSVLLSGFSKSLSLELADTMKGHIDYRSASHAMGVSTAATVVDALMSDIPSSCIHYDGKEWCQPRLVRQSMDVLSATAAEPLTPDAFYIIAGGTGSIGLGVAQRLIHRGAKHIVLLSRSGVSPSSVAHGIVETLRQQAQVLTPEIDITDRDALQRLLAQLREQYPIGGVVHAAGIFDITPLSALTPEACLSLMDNKVLGFRWLDELTADDNLTMFIGFSSIASVWGSAGNFHYTAANYCIDAIVHRRNARGQHAVVINWGPWANSNMVTDESEVLANKRGLYAMDAESALDWFDRLSMGQHSQVVVAKIQWSTLSPLLALTNAGALVAGLADIPPAAGGDRFSEGTPIALESTQSVALNAADIAFKQRLSELTPEEAQPALLAYITQQLADALETEVDDIDVFQPLLNLGIDSLMAVEFKNRVTKVTGVEIPLVKLLEGSHLCDLSNTLCHEFFLLPQQEGDSTDEENSDILLEGAL